MDSSSTDARATLDRWKARGADRHDPVRFRFIEALERRAASHRGDARRILDEKLSRLIEAYAADVESSASQMAHSEATLPPVEPAHGKLRELVDWLTSRPASRSSANAERAAVSGIAAPDSKANPAQPLDYFRELWAKVSVEAQLRQSLQQVPDNAGPLNSESLVHRSLALMQEVSPDYLRQFLSYIEALSSIEQLNDRSAARTPPRRSSSPRTPSRSRSSA